MPKEADYKVIWSEALKGYEIIHTPFSFPLLNEETLHCWLDMIDTFHFCSPMGYTMTVCKEKRGRNGSYWYAYKRAGVEVKKRYLGKKSEMTLTLLERVARQLVESVEPSPVPSSQPQEPVRKPTLVFTKTLDSALHIYGFRSLPTKKDLVNRYRELSKKHHPDAGGLHEDMVAVNLAYDYLKRFLS
jgi:hypothetical protein